MVDINSIRTALISGDENTLLSIVEDNMQSGAEAEQILKEGLINSMGIVGERMESGEMFIPEVLRCAKIMSTIVEILKPHLPDSGVKAAGKVVIGTVKGDLHDLGKNLVIMMLESSGFEVIDLGIDVAPEAFFEAVRENIPDILGISALLTTTTPMMKQTVDTLVDSGLRDQIKIIVGGAPITQTFSDEIGADGFAPDAGSAAKLAKRLLS